MENSSELVIADGTIVDGTGKERYEGDIRIAGGIITEIGGKISRGKEVIDAKGLIVSPGVIDIHGHSNATVYKNPSFESKIFQGITTEVWGNCGQSFAPILGGENKETVKNILSASLGAEDLNMEWSTFQEYLNHLPRLGMNVLPLIGHSILRTNIMGKSERAPSESEMAQMISLLEDCLKMGAYGMSTGLEYFPGTFSTKRELVELCKVLSRYEAFYSTHIRNEDRGLWESIDEALQVSEESGCPVHISHLKLAGRNNWGESQRLMNYLTDAHDRGIAVTWDVYPYTAWGGGFEDIFPNCENDRERLAGIAQDPELEQRIKKEIAEELKLRGSSWDKITINHAAKSTGVQGKNIKEIARECKEDVLDTFIRILIENDGVVKIIGHDMNQDDMKYLLKHSDTIIATDSRAITFDSAAANRYPHPRYCGSIPKVLRFAREGLFSYEEAIRKMTSLPADRVKLWNRGRIEKGKFADLMIFDPDEVTDRATYEDPVQPPAGIVHVLIDGQLVISNGVHTGKLVGQMLKQGRKSV
jgi:N-acyl-D-amino-acid deacylase